MDKASLIYLSKYMDVTDEVKTKITRHCKRYGLKEDICAWYSDMEDFFSDWCAIGYTRTKARKVYHGGIGEFITFPNGNIIRIAI